MNRRSFMKSVVGAGIVAMVPNIVLGAAERDELESVGSLFGNSFEHLPKGTTSEVEIVSEVISEYGGDVVVVIRNNSPDKVYLSDIVGMVRSEEGTPLATPILTSVAPAFVEADEYAIALVSLSDMIDHPDTAIIEFEVKTEPLENTFNHWYSNVSVVEASPTKSGIIGQVENTTGKSPAGSNWLVVAVCFDDEGNLVSGGMDFQHATQEFNEGGSQVFNARFDEAPTKKFLVAAVATI